MVVSQSLTKRKTRKRRRIPRMPRSLQSAQVHFDKMIESTETIPTQAGVYQFLGGNGEIIYVGKAKSLRRRLLQYRNAKCTKTERKMCKIVLLASGLRWTETLDEREALLLEDQTIKTHRPLLNVDGAFFFIYPSIGLVERDGGFDLIYTTQIDAWPEVQKWFGCFRSRLLAREAFESLETICGLLGFTEKSLYRGRKYSKSSSYRARERNAPPLLERFLSGKDHDALAELSEWLLEHPTARSRAPEMETSLKSLQEFQKKEITPIAKARLHFGHTQSFVTQEERDRWMIEWRILQQS